MEGALCAAIAAAGVRNDWRWRWRGCDVMRGSVKAYATAFTGGAEESRCL